MNAMQWKKRVTFICTVHRGNTHFINADFIVFVHGQKLFVNAGAPNDPHLVVVCGFQMRQQFRHGFKPVFIRVHMFNGCGWLRREN